MQHKEEGSSASLIPGISFVTNRPLKLFATNDGIVCLVETMGPFKVLSRDERYLVFEIEIKGKKWRTGLPLESLQVANSKEGEML